MSKLISQYPDIKKYASDYLFQIDDLVRDLYDLKNKLTEILFSIETKACHGRCLLNKGDTYLVTLKDSLKELPSSYSEKFFFLEGIIIDLLKRKKILHRHYKTYLLALKEVEKVARRDL
ncbi:hypothetical protein [Rickettsiella endosymbiont of Miltochrista miniata]|uniref:hypothetical protein n=1 Tax=Rickettsiella endosymbiont of Miltochrista miniata TaxID=3066239 RepID=UPI00313C573B